MYVKLSGSYLMGRPLLQKICCDRTQSTNKYHKAFSNYYYFQNGDKTVCICKEFFLKTFDISQRRINYFFARAVNHKTGFPRGPCKRKGAFLLQMKHFSK
jgi:hypothetical protein